MIKLGAIKLAILKEGKIPADKRVPLTPVQCRSLLNQYPRLKIAVQSSDIRCFTDDQYREQGITVMEDISDCDLFLGVKEVPVNMLIPEKSYLFFSHTIKKQPYNRKMLQDILKKNIRLIDYELLTDKNGGRIIGFGRYAGIVGAYNGLLTYGRRFGYYDLKPAWLCADKNEMFNELKKVKLPAVKLLFTGSGRVANGVMEIMEELKLTRVSVEDYLNKKFNEAVYVQLEPGDYNKRRNGQEFDLLHFFGHPSEYISDFKRFLKMTDIFISSAYWDPKAPCMFDKDDMKNGEFGIKVIADITCDINGGIPSTIRSTSIQSPFYDFDRVGLMEVPAFSGDNNITVMAVDNLPCELPKDASREFGSQLINRILPNIIGPDRDKIIERATIAEYGSLTQRFSYLKDYTEGM